MIKVKKPGCGDDTRNWGPPYDERGQSTYFQAANRNKSAIALDLRSATDLDTALELVEEADIVIENFRPGVMDRLGLGYEQTNELNPRLVYCSIAGFGSGDGADLPGYDLLVQALGGLMSITGEPEGDPQKVGVALVDVIAGLFSAVGILAALRHRDKSGKGQRVEVDLLSSLLAALVNQASAHTLAHVVPQRMGNGHPSISPYELYSTGDGAIVLTVGNDRQFRALCEVIGARELATDDRFSSNPARVAAREELRDELDRHFAIKSAASWVEDLTGRGVPAGVVNDISQAFRLASKLGLDPIVSVPRDDGTSARLVPILQQAP